MGPNGGLLHDHANGITINNNNSVYTMVFGGPQSLAKVYSTSVGEYGTVVGPQKMGNLEQWTGIGWKWYGNYGIMSENNIIRCEVSSSLSNT
jgi:hypothetical protein